MIQIHTTKLAPNLWKCHTAGMIPAYGKTQLTAFNKMIKFNRYENNQ